ncbi:MAG: ABC transporter ATP-binding protein [Lachnospiraceae bacterium]|nr:ABC transporter ATP-binding protein [Lachnospiraceae bacterium]
MAEKVLEVKNLVVSFRTQQGTVQAVRDLSFDLYKGETLALVGESGAGKTVTGRAVMGLLANNAVLEKGEILFRGQDLTKLKEKSLSRIRGRGIAMIFQDPFSSLNPIMRIGAQLTEAILAVRGSREQTAQLSRKEAKAKALQLLESVGIDEAEKRLSQYPFELSGGMRQRVVIAIALAQDPEILICDEPTTALDVTIQAQILELLKKVRSERDFSVLFITHDMGVVADMADRVAILYAGRLCEIGTAKEIFYQPEHPYTWALLQAVPDPSGKGALSFIPGQPPDMLHPPMGDAFASRNPDALPRDFEEQPPLFQLSETHFAATWRLENGAQAVSMPASLRKRIEEQTRGKGVR